MDVLSSGSERAPVRLPSLRAMAPPPRVVALVAAVVLLAGLAAVLPVRRAEERAASFDRLRVELRLAGSQRELVNAAFGRLELVVTDLRGRALRLDDVSLRVPGFLVGRQTDLPATSSDGRVAVPVRFVVPACQRLRLPGELVLRGSRPGRSPEQVRRPVVRGGGPGAVDGTPLLVACGQAEQRQCCATR